MTAHNALRLAAAALFIMAASRDAASQIQITQADVESLAGKFQVSYRAVSPFGFDLSVAGANKLWDLTGYVFNTTPGLTVTHDTFPPPGGPEVNNPAFAQANYAIRSESPGSLAWQYAKVTSAGVEVIGNIDTITAVLSPGLKIVGAFPLAFGSSWSSTSSVSSPIIPSGISVTISASGSVDSWGTMVIPAPGVGTASKSVLRVRLQQTTTFKMITFVLYQVSSVSYQWLGSPSSGQFYIAAASADSLGGVATTLSYYTPFNVAPVSVTDRSPEPVASFGLLPNYPNPFNPETVIPFEILQEGAVELKLYNTLGQDLATLVSGRLSAGRHEVRFDAGGFPSGLYIVRLESGGAVSTRPITLLR